MGEGGLYQDEVLYILTKKGAQAPIPPSPLDQPLHSHNNLCEVRKSFNQGMYVEVHLPIHYLQFIR